MNPVGQWGWGEEVRRWVCVQWLAPSHLSLFHIRKAEQTRGFAVEPVKLVLGSLGLFSSVLWEVGNTKVCLLCSAH